MALNIVDWSIIVSYFLITLLVGVIVMRRASRSSSEFFLAGRNMPWWLLGVSMVATTFSSDTPNLVTDIVRQNGVAGNWVWWPFLLTGMMTVFIYAKLWRRSGVMTDIEFYELRYSGKAAAFLRGFRAIYLGVFFNVLIMAMVGSVAAAVVALNHEAVGGLGGLLANKAIQPKLSMMPDFSNTDALMAVFIIPLAVQWWSVWYPGAEPGGGGYIAQRMLAAKDERNATAATLLFNVAHYAVRPWAWILVALCSLLVFPDLDSLRVAFPNINSNVIGHDLAYPAMLTLMPHGLLGFTLASLIAAYMSTISTHLNWGSSYLVNDVYKRFVRNYRGHYNVCMGGHNLCHPAHRRGHLASVLSPDSSRRAGLASGAAAGQGRR